MSAITTPTTQSTPLVGVVILNWNNWRGTLKSVVHVKRSNFQSIKLYIVDNASTDESIKEITLVAKEPYQLIQSKTNRGWAGGNNLEYPAYSDNCNYVFLLNADVSVTPTTITELVSEASKLKNTARRISGPLRKTTPSGLNMRARPSTPTTDIQLIFRGTWLPTISAIPQEKRRK